MQAQRTPRRADHRGIRTVAAMCDEFRTRHQRGVSVRRRSVGGCQTEEGITAEAIYSASGRGTQRHGRALADAAEIVKGSVWNRLTRHLLARRFLLIGVTGVAYGLSALDAALWMRLRLRQTCHWRG